MQNKIEYLENRIKQLESEINNLHSVVSELKILNEIAITAGRTDNVDQTLKLILNKTINAVSAEHRAILLVSENKELLKTFISQQKNSKIGNRPRIREHIMG